MAGVKDFTELLFWQRARQLSKRIFFFTKRSPFASDKRLVVQINDSSESVIANIAEGFGRGTQGEFIQFLGYALGSLNETQAHLCASFDREYITREEFAAEYQEATEIRKMAVSFIRKMTMHGSGVKHVQKYVDWKAESWERLERIAGVKKPKWLLEIERKKQEAQNEENNALLRKD